MVSKQLIVITFSSVLVLQLKISFAKSKGWFDFFDIDELLVRYISILQGLSVWKHSCGQFLPAALRHGLRDGGMVGRRGLGHFGPALFLCGSNLKTLSEMFRFSKIAVDVGRLLYKAVNVGQWPQKLSNLWPSFTSCPLLWLSFTSCPLMWPSFTSRPLPAVIYMRIIPAPIDFVWIEYVYSNRISVMISVLNFLISWRALSYQDV